MNGKVLSVVIFSKDRAAQLDLCLKSIYKNMEGFLDKLKIYIVYTASSHEFETAYTNLSGEWNSLPSIYFMPEKKYKGFKKTLEYCMNHWEEYVLFFTDDDIVYRKFEHDFSIFCDAFGKNENLFCISLRLGTNTFVQDQYINSMCLIPDEVIISENTVKIWNWKTQSMGEHETNFGYPFSVDGHMFKSKNAKWIIKNTEYYNPNTLEAKAHRTHVMDTEYAENLSDEMACFKNSYVINTPLNRVQDTFTNSAGIFFEETQESLNNRFLKGHRLTLDGMDFSTIIGVHQELKLCWDNK